MPPCRLRRGSASRGDLRAIAPGPETARALADIGVHVVWTAERGFRQSRWPAALQGARRLYIANAALDPSALSLVLGTDRLAPAALPPDAASRRALDPDAGPGLVPVANGGRAGALRVATTDSGSPPEPAGAAPATLAETDCAVADRGRMVARRASSQLLAQRDFPCPAKPCFNAAPSSEPRGLRASAGPTRQRPNAVCET